MAKDYGNIFDVVPLYNISMVALIFMQSSRAWSDKVFFINGRAHVDRLWRFYASFLRVAF